MKKQKVIYVLSTHWDREWYQTFQDFRYRLVGLFDHLLKGFKTGKLRGPFQTDGQVIVLEDYLEVRPERSDEVMKYLKDGKFVSGPWYVMPDEFLISGESMIRNLRMGREWIRNHGGKPSDAGFICDIFGHNSQMPQIFAGFGIKGIFLWRGINLFDKRQILWKSADGTTVMTYVFGKVGYCDVSAKCRKAFDHYKDTTTEESYQEMLDYLNQEKLEHPLGTILAFDGGDHQGWENKFYKAICKFMDDPKSPYQMVHGSLDDYIAENIKNKDKIGIVVEGELREPAKFMGDKDYRWLIPGVLSSRVWIKQDNTDCESQLCQWAEPFSTFSSIALDEDYPKGFLDVAWKWLIKNHPHDSICGCSIDQVHEDMKFRFGQCKGIANRLTTESLRKLSASVEGKLENNQLRLTVFNPLPTEITNEVIELTVEIPSDWPMFAEFFGFEQKPSFRIFDSNNQEIPYQRLSQKMDQPKFRIRPDRFPEAYKTHDVSIAISLSVPAMGFTAFTVCPNKPPVKVGVDTFPVDLVRYPEVPGLATSERSMANEFLDVVINENGSLTLTDKRTEKTYSRLLTFEDCADIGDGWYHGVAVNDQTFTSTACHSDIALLHNGPELCKFRIKTKMNLPEEFCFASMTRAEKTAELFIDNLVTLRKTNDYIEIETRIENIIKDHRLRVLFPTGADATTYLADSIFDVVERPIALRSDNHIYRELEIESKPQRTWTAVFDNSKGLAVVSKGLLESAVRDISDRPIALTLFRSTRRTVFTNGEPNGQLLQPLTFNYWIKPLSGDPNRTELGLLGQKLAAGVKQTVMNSADIDLYRTDASTLPSAMSFLSVKGDILVTSFRQIENNVELRVFNPTMTKSSAVICCPKKMFSKAAIVNFESNPAGEKFSVKDGKIKIDVKPKQILTISLKR
jgi:alpha-mannosidase/mannosylglycerate hydrolase